MGRLHIYLHEWCICVVNDQVNIYHHPMNPMEFWCGFQCELLSHLCGLCRNGTSVEDKMKQPGRKTSTSTSLCSKMWENTGKTTCFTKLLADVFSRRDSEMMEKTNDHIAAIVLFLVPVTHVLKTHSWFGSKT